MTDRQNEQARDDDEPLCNLLYAGLAVEGGATVVSIDERDRYPQVRLDTTAFDGDALAKKLDALASSVRALHKCPTHRDLARLFTGSVIRSVDKQIRDWKRTVSEGRKASAPERARILSRPTVASPQAPEPPIKASTVPA